MTRGPELAPARSAAARAGGVEADGGRRPGARALLFSVAAAAFFSVTFVLNRSMAQADGHWAWSASLRFYLMLPLLAVLLTVRSQWGALGMAWRTSPRAWLLWGTVGFVLFYAPLTAASSLAPAWMVAGMWPVSIVAGLLVSPLIYTDHRRRIPGRALAVSMILVLGVMLLQLEHARSADWRTAGTALLLVLVAAVAYPLGNRRMMLVLEAHDDRARVSGAAPATDTLVRLTAMTLGSIPAWLVVSLYGYSQAGLAPGGQVVQAGIVALCSGVVATWLFFAATDAVRRDPVALAGVEAAQAAEVPFALVLEMSILGAVAPAPLGLFGLAVIVAGIVAHARLTGR